MKRLDSEATIDDALAPYWEVDRHPVDGRPWVLANMVCGLDGSTAIDGRVGALSSPVDRKLFVDLRSVADVVLVGAETVRRERYGPVRLSADRRDARQQAGRPPLPRLGIVSRSLDLDLDGAAFAPEEGGAPPLIVTCEASPADARRRLEGVTDVVMAGTDRVEPGLALGALARLGHRVVLCEGGPSLLGDLLAHEVVDELCLTLAPVLGGDPLPVAVMPATSGLSRMRLAHVLEDDSNLFLRYEAR
jgi:riboflavin biosynthesis pyrimidine reductase